MISINNDKILRCILQVQYVVLAGSKLSFEQQ